jgi:hypothetical protein
MAYPVHVRLTLSSIFVLLLSAGCTHVPIANVRDVGPNACTAQSAGTVCFGDEALQCDGDGNTIARTDCGASGQVCAPGLGCRVCVPRRVSCAGETIQVCNTDGTQLDTSVTCDPTTGQHCSTGGCIDLCAQAVTDHSYIGCDYYPTVLPNSELNPNFHFAIVIANPQLVSAEVTILRSTNVVEQLVVPAGQLAVRELDWNAELRGDDSHPASVLVRDDSYHVISDVPVTITQFNPLRYQVSPTCTSTANADGCFSYTNDASLLLPVHVLTGSYIAMSRPTHILANDDPSTNTHTREVSPGYLAVANAEDHRIEVTIRSTAYTLASDDGAVPRLSPGESHTFTLEVGDVLVLESGDPPLACPGETDSDTRGNATFTYCNPGPEYDLTGSEIVSTERIAAFSGHNCTFVPYNRWACDHLEEQLFPVESLGGDLFVPVTHPLRAGEPNLLRIVAAGASAHLRFDPPLADGTSSVSLARGEYTEHAVSSDVWVHSDAVDDLAPISAALFFVGQNFLGFGLGAPGAVGDPAMALIVPTVQYRRSYAFLAPDTYAQSYIGVAIPNGGQVYLDEAPITGMLADSAATSMRTGQILIHTGPHQIRGDHPFGLYVYGFGSYTSYITPGGMDFVSVRPPF